MAGMQRYFPDPRDARAGTKVSAAGLAGTVDAMQRTLHGKGVKQRMGGSVLIQGGGDGGVGGGRDFRLGKFVELNTDGNTMEVYLWNGTDWAEETTTIYKPMIFQEQMWNGQTIPDAIGVERSYDVTDLDIRYQRRATWEEDEVEYTEVQKITSLYEVGEWLYIIYDQYGNNVDDNNAGRHWAVNGDLK